MNILMATNTFTPHVGGVARSVQSFTDQFRAMGHRVLVLAPQDDKAPAEEPGVLRLPALQNFNNSEFSVPLVVPGMLMAALEEFQPQVVHCHHPFLLGSTAMRVAGTYNLPIVFTHHTRYETYTHYLPVDTPAIQRFAVQLATGFCNLCDAVIAPSESIADMLRASGVEARIEIIPTGVDVGRFLESDGSRARARLDLPPEAFVVGHVGRLAPEKNLGFLAEAVAAFLREHPAAHFLVVGHGPSEEEIGRLFEAPELRGRLHLAGTLEGQQLLDAYAAMDVFAFASQSETQGMVITEAMAAGVPVVAVDASGVRDVVEDGVNGRLLAEENLDAFRDALNWAASLSPAERTRLSLAVHATAERLSLGNCAGRLLKVYEELVRANRIDRPIDDSAWAKSLRWLEEELKIVSNYAGAMGNALTS